jgi:hypothetical protein
VLSALDEEGTKGLSLHAGWDGLLVASTTGVVDASTAIGVLFVATPFAVAAPAGLPLRLPFLPLRLDTTDLLA